MSRKVIIGAAGLALVLALGFTINRFNNTPRLSESTDFLMDTVVTVKVYALPSARAKETVAKAFTEAKRVALIMDPYTDGGELKEINEADPASWQHLSPELSEVLHTSAHYWELTGGAFDPTTAVVKWFWNFNGDGPVPSPDELAKALQTVGFDKVELQGDSLRLGSAGTKLDLGAIAKGYIVDRMAAVLREGGITAGLVIAGGQIYSFGKKPDGKDWVIGLRHPRKDETIEIDTMPFSAVATSGDYERYFIVDGHRYHHILDPVTGYPANGCVSVTIWTDTGIDADALSTGVFVMGPEKGLALAEKLDHVEALIFYEDNGVLKMVKTSGVQEKVDF